MLMICINDALNLVKQGKLTHQNAYESVCKIIREDIESGKIKLYHQKEVFPIKLKK